MIVQGKNFLIWHYDNGEWKLHACAASGDLTVNTAVLETSGPGTGVWSTFIARKHNITANLEGVTFINETGKLGIAELRAMQYACIPQRLRFERTDEEGGVYTDEFFALIVNSQDGGRVNEFATFNVQFQGTGAVTQIFTPTQQGGGNVQKYDDYIPVEGSTGFTVGALANQEILEFVKDGVGLDVIDAPAVPGPKQVSYNIVTGEFITGSPFAGDEQKPYIIYQPI